MAAATSSTTLATASYGNMSIDQLDAFISELTKIRKEKVGSIVKIFGQYFTEKIGAGKIESIPEAHQKLHLDLIAQLEALFRNSKYPTPLKPIQMGNNATLRGQNSDRSFIMIKVEVRDSTTKRVIGVSTEIILQRYAAADMTSNYVTSNRVDENSQDSSYLYSNGSMSDKQIEALRDLLEGKEIVAPEDDTKLLRLFKHESDVTNGSCGSDWELL